MLHKEFMRVTFHLYRRHFLRVAMPFSTKFCRAYRGVGTPKRKYYLKLSCIDYCDMASTVRSVLLHYIITSKIIEEIIVFGCYTL